MAKIKLLYLLTNEFVLIENLLSWGSLDSYISNINRCPLLYHEHIKKYHLKLPISKEEFEIIYD